MNWYKKAYSYRLRVPMGSHGLDGITRHEATILDVVKNPTKEELVSIIASSPDRLAKVTIDSGYDMYAWWDQDYVHGDVVAALRDQNKQVIANSHAYWDVDGNILIDGINHSDEVSLHDKSETDPILNKFPYLNRQETR